MSVRTRLSNDQYYYLRNILTDYVDTDTGVMRLRSEELLEQLQIKLNEAFADIPTAISSSHLRRIVADAGYTLRRNRVCRTSIKDLETQIDKTQIDKMSPTAEWIAWQPTLNAGYLVRKMIR